MSTGGCLLRTSQAKACATPEMPDRRAGEIMRCSKCGSDNREGRKFCTTCGTLLVVSCPKCGAPIQPSDRFCGECGADLSDALPVAIPDVAPLTALASGERRHLT